MGEVGCSPRGPAGFQPGGCRYGRADRLTLAEGVVNARSGHEAAVLGAEKGYHGAGSTICTPFKRHRLRQPLSRDQRSVNRSHARILAQGERAVATLKTWKALAQLRCCPCRTTSIVQALLVLQFIEEGRYSG
ncbi:transposase family protein [[Actinomadura] parvosata]|uniref:transposase family protein n=1 Tax=[Actinomadura] parvosata TaxID=1955412 RepID=UPI00406D2019